jgi:CRP/FNR family transcriptional regulator
METNVEQKIAKFFGQYPTRTYPKGQILLFANENPENIFYLASGKVITYDISYRGEEIITNAFKPPAFFPMSWAINRTPNTLFYKTDSKTIVHIVPVDKALTFLKENTDVMYDLLSRLYRGVDGMTGRLVHLMSGTARSRLMYELVIEARRFGEKQPDGSYRLSTNEQDIAARAGLSRETVNREMRHLKTNDLVRIEKKMLVIVDLDGLQSSLNAAL